MDDLEGVARPDQLAAGHLDRIIEGALSPDRSFLALHFIGGLRQVDALDAASASFLLTSCARAISARHVSSVFVPVLSDGCVRRPDARGK